MPPRIGHILFGMSRPSLIVCAALTAALVPFLLSQSSVKRPPITGVAHVAIKTNDLAAARRFYGRDLGFSDALAMPERLGPAAWFKVNDHQYLEIYETLKSEDDDRLIEIAFETADAKTMREYLAGKGVEVPATVSKGWDGNLSFQVKDPEGHRIAFVQYLTDSIPGKQFGLLMPASRVSEHMIHAGFLVKDRGAEDHFFKDILGFDEMWHGGKTDTSADWISLRVPEGEDWLEYMCNVQNLTPKTRGIMNHVAFGVPEMDAAAKILQSRQAPMPEKPKIGRDGKWQLNLYDPNLTRAELMEPKPVETPCCSELKPHRGPEGAVRSESSPTRDRWATPRPAAKRRIRHGEARVPHHGGRRERLGHNRRVLFHLDAHGRRSQPDGGCDLVRDQPGRTPQGDANGPRRPGIRRGVCRCGIARQRTHVAAVPWRGE